MKVLQINGGGDTGGAKSHIVALLPELRNLGLQTELLCFSPGLLSQEVAALGIPTHCLGFGSLISPTLLWKLYRYLKKVRPDIVHTHGGRANLYGRIAAKLAGVPVVVTTVHSHIDLDYAIPWQNRWYAVVDKCTWSLADGLIAVSTELAQALVQKGLARRKVRVVHNGITAGELGSVAVHTEFALPSSAKVVCAVGRLVPVKRFDILLEALAIVLVQYPDTHLLLVGEGPLEHELKDRAKDLGLATHITFTGYRRDARAIMRAADVFVVSSDMEGHPIVLLEALSGKVPVVATAVGGIPEVITSGNNGLLVDPRNPVGLAHAISSILENPSAARVMAERGKTWVDNNATAAAMAKKTVELYEEWRQFR